MTVKQQTPFIFSKAFLYTFLVLTLLDKQGKNQGASRNKNSSHGNVHIVLLYCVIRGLGGSRETLFTKLFQTSDICKEREERNVFD